MKITIEPSEDQFGQKHPYDKVSIETPHDDLHIDEALELAHRALVAWGYHKENIEKHYE